MDLIGPSGPAAEVAARGPIRYTSHEVCRLVGISYRQLDYWCRCGYLGPSCMATRGPGMRRAFSPEDLKLVREQASLRKRMAQLQERSRAGAGITS